jgi:hypothetical protein
MKTTFVETLPDRRGGGRHPDPALVQFAADVRANPDRWALYPNTIGPRSGSALVRYISSGQGAFSGGGFEAAVRAGVLYVRYTGT